MSFYMFLYLMGITIVIALYSALNKAKRAQRPVQKIEEKEILNSTISDDGHCHIVHEEAEEGYVVLNGVKRKLEDCARL